MSKNKKAKRLAPEDRKKKSLDDLWRILSHPEQRGRVVKPTEIIRKMGTSKGTFYRYIDQVQLAQTWLEINQDAPLDAKAHYKNMLDEGLKGLEADVSVTVGRKQGSNNGGKKFYVEKEQARIIASRAAEMIGRDPETDKARVANANVTVREVKKETEMVEVDAKAKMLSQLREAFIMAPLGDMPDIGKMMRDFGLIDSQGNATGDLTLAEVRNVAIEEEWKQDRAMHLHRSLDIIPEEVKAITMVRNLEVQKLMFQEIKLIHRMNAQYYNTGQVKSLDGTKILEYSPDHGVIAGMAEVMRRMVDGGSNVNILINQFGDRSVNGGAPSVSMVTRSYLKELAEMDPATIEAESRKFEALSRMLADDTQGKISIEQIEAQERGEIIEVEATNVDESKSKP